MKNEKNEKCKKKNREFFLQHQRKCKKHTIAIKFCNFLNFAIVREMVRNAGKVHLFIRDREPCTKTYLHYRSRFF